MKPTEFIFLNHSNNRLVSQNVVAYQNPWSDKGDSNRQVIAWQVIKQCSQQSYRPFSYSHDMYITVKDTHGNLLEPILCQEGTTILIKKTTGTLSLKYDTKTIVPSSKFEILNKTKKPLDILFYRNKHPFAAYLNFPPLLNYSISIPTSIFVSLTGNVSKSDVLNLEQLLVREKEIKINELTSVDIIMKGGGDDQNAKPYEFTTKVSNSKNPFVNRFLPNRATFE